MSLESYHENLLATVGSLADSEGEFTSTAFTRYCSEILTEGGEFDDAIVLDFEGTGNHRRRLRVNGYDLENPDNSVALIVSQYHGTSTIESLSTTESKAQLKALQFFLQEATEGTFFDDREESSPAYQLAHDLNNRGRNVSRYRLYLVTDGRISDRLKELPAETINGIPVDFQLWDIDRLHQLHESQSGREALQIDVNKWLPDGIPALQVSSSSEFSTYLAAVPGQVLSSLYGQYGNRLLESNVRSYLTSRGKVNQGIRTTIYKSPDKFMAYNNGVTATASSVSVDPATGAIKFIEDLQIVNGGQTTASLFYVAREAKNPHILQDVFVQMKLVVVDPIVANDLVPSISRFANSQNAVSTADFFSNSLYHVRLEELSRRVLAPAAAGATYNTKWYYERTRGQYENDKNIVSRSMAARFDKMYPKHQKFDKPGLAKVLMSWDQKPHVVSAGAQKNFLAFAAVVTSAWEKDEASFNEQYFQEIVAKTIVFNDVRKYVAESDWYRESRGYLANIVAYTVAKLALLIEEQGYGMVLDFGLIWRHQSTPDFLLEFCGAIAKVIQAELVDDSRPVQNVTEWAKKPDLWKRVASLPIKLPAAVSSSLISKTAVLEKKKAARETQKVDNGISVQIKVVNVPQEDWQQLREFTQRNGISSPTDLGILDIVTGRRPGIPSERQSARLLKLLEAASTRGFQGFSM
ncbi:AIPR family protein [Arthrobacter caoxuetaonis]|uniref:AIPR family protein n=1 Tax=Arthrobacter caoxuetaonis TaxID=2886935 RepID=UPI001D1517CB|nr:AIPR family protein [Arthrobacter caoxuetaonis]MCC3282071.1 AIPR family protein [Arthrobacter caoxuetaonis]